MPGLGDRKDATNNTRARPAASAAVLTVAAAAAPKLR